MNRLNSLRLKGLLLCAAATFLFEAPAHASLCSLPDTAGSNPVVTVNPKPFIIPPPSTCLENGLPGAATDLTSFVPVASRTANITVSSVKVGDLYDRVYCTGTIVAGVSVCDGTNTYLLATRAHMISSPLNFPARNMNCPVWSGTSNDCFEINNFFRAIRGTSAAPVAAKVGYWMGSTTVGDTNPNTALAVKYMEYSGKTFQGLGQFIPGTTVATRDNTHVMFWADTNTFDPDGLSSPWSPWFYVVQNCPNTSGGAHFVLTNNFAIKYWEGGEEGQIQDNIQALAYTCVP